MTRLVALVIAVTGVGGFALGWFVLSAPRETPAPPPDAPAPVAHRFALSPADVRLDRETPAVAVDSRNRVLLAWAAETGENERTLWLARSSDGGRTFAPPVAFRKVPTYSYASKMKGKEITRTTNAVPRLCSSGESIVLGWTEAVGGGPRVDFLVARSTDGGATFKKVSGTFSPEKVPDTFSRANGGDALRPAFTGLTTGADGSVACTWLDSRNKSQQPFCAVMGAGSAAFLPERLVYGNPSGGGVCPCCDTEAVVAPGGVTFVAFRNNDADYRDVCVARSRGGDFEPPVTVNRERWKFNGCPHDGPALALVGDRLHVAWMDAHTGRRRLYHASSALDELRFEPREVCPTTSGEQGHPRLAAAGGELHAVWDAASGDEPAAPPEEHAEHGHHPLTGGGRSVMYAEWTAGGCGGRALDPRPGAFQVNPALAVGPDGADCVVWNEITEAGKSVAFVRVEPDRRGGAH